MKPEQDLSSAPVGLQRNTTSAWKFKGREKSGRSTDRSSASGRDTWLHWFQGGQAGHTGFCLACGLKPHQQLQGMGFASGAHLLLWLDTERTRFRHSRTTLQQEPQHG